MGEKLPGHQSVRHQPRYQELLAIPALSTTTLIALSFSTSQPLPRTHLYNISQRRYYFALDDGSYIFIIFLSFRLLYAEELLFSRDADAFHF
jgi:hypothetical protein